MKWFFAYNQENAYNQFSVYEHSLKIAVNSAITNDPYLEPHLLYDGKPSELTAWLESKGTKIIYVRSCLYNLFELLAKTSDYNLGVAAGTYLRIEVPRICKELGYTDKYVLYTDCDVMFLGIKGIENLTPSLFACAPEICVEDKLNFNAGVMLMNVDSMLNSFDEFIKWNNNNYPESIAKLDQIGLQNYYGNKVESLDPIYNWKPYWGFRNNVLVHFHGPKDEAIDILLDKNNPNRSTLDPMLHSLFKKSPFAYKKYREMSVKYLHM